MTPQQLGQLLTQARKIKGYTSEDMKMYSGLNAQTIVNIEKGRNYTITSLLSYLKAIDAHISLTTKTI